MKKIFLNILLYMTLLSTAAPLSTIVQAESPSPTEPVTVQEPLVKNPLTELDTPTENTENPIEQKESSIVSEQRLEETHSTPNKLPLENKLDTIIPSLNVGNSNLLNPSAKLENYAINQYYDSVTMERIDGDTTTPIKNGDKIDYYDQFNISFNWSVPNSANLVDGDVITSALPPELNPLRTGPLNVTNDKGIVVGSWKIIVAPTGEKTLEFTVNPAFVSLTNRSGTINFTAQLDFSQVQNKNQWIQLAFDTKAQEVINLDVKKAASIDPNERLYKFGQVDTSNPEIVIWSIRVNYSGVKSNRTTIVDLPVDQEYMPDRIWASWGEYNKDTGEYTQIEPVPNSSIYGRVGGGFEIEFGDIGEGTNRPSGIINVAMKANDGGTAGRYFNRILSYSSGSQIRDLTVSTPKSGGGGDGDGNSVLTVRLVDSTDPSINLDGGKFSVFEDGKSLGVHNAVAGAFKITAKPGSKYSIRQTQVGTRSGYVVYDLDESLKTVTITGDTEVVFSNTPLKGSIKLTKVDADDSSIVLPGAKFEIIDPMTNEVLIENLVTDENGEIIVSNLDPRNYLFSETEPPPGYELNPLYLPLSLTNQHVSRPGTEQFFNFMNSGNFSNKKAAKEISLIKKDKENPSTLLPDAHFDLYKEGESAPIKTDLITDVSGIINVALDYGDYYFQETIPPTGYVLDETKQRFTVSSAEQTPLVVFNEKQRVTMIDSQFPSDLNFGTHSIQNSSDEKWLATVDGNQTSKTTTGTLKVDDNRTTTSGWKLKAKQLEQFKNGVAELTGAHLLVTAGTVNSTAKIIPSNGIQGTTATLIPNEEKTIFGAKANEGTGISTLELSKFELSVPKTATKKVAKYSSSIVWTLSDTP
ncbi:SpaA isopeptide-forming pilin-related protein [Carnobacterium divergens]|uniref:SpaA isopeptide-forming pilin-related protein n=1 Tax=Carnobacterium divergens TaxID=2748 RepID=UPI0039B0BDD9